MQPDMFNYRDYVPALVYTVEAGRVEDLLQADYSKAAHVRGKGFPASAQAVMDGLSRMVADFKARPVARETLDAAKAGVEADLQVSLGHERELESLLSSVDKQRRDAAALRVQKAYAAEQKNLLASIDALIQDTKAELHSSQVVSEAYRAALEELAGIPAKILTPVEAAQVEFADARIAKLQEFQRLLKENPGEAVARANEFRLGEVPPGLFPPDPPSPINPERYGPSSQPQRNKSPRQRLDERSALVLAGALIFAIPSLLLIGISGALIFGTIGMGAGAALYPVIGDRL
jgi:uncharacterized protein YciW